MTIDLFWDNVKILNIKKEDDVYISSVYSDNINTVKNSGFPIFFLKEISVVSDELPNIVKQRISNINNIKGKLRFKNDYSSEEIEENIYNYINTTKCRRPTDKFSIKIEIR